jgi:2'-5' RNA ligase/GNAT superfamily N-acetyltransferase
MPRARRRLGVVLLVPDPVLREIDGLRRALGDSALGRVLPHLTLVPPVNVSEDDLALGLDVLHRAADAMTPFDLQLGPVATFHPVSPTVYLAVGGDVGSVHRLRDAVFTRPFVRRLEYAFVPHVTIADDVPVDRIASALVALQQYLVEVAVDRLYLLEEIRLDDGRRVWEPLADAWFGPTPVVSRGGLELELSVSDLVPPDVAAAIDSIPGGDPVMPEARPARGLVVTARRAGAVVGVAVGWTLGDLAHLDVVAVSGSHRREGAGSHLVAYFESASAERGCTEVASLAPDEPAILALLARRGWARHLDRGRRRDEPMVLRRTL